MFRILIVEDDSSRIIFLHNEIQKQLSKSGEAILITCPGLGQIYKSTVKELKKTKYDLIFLDHDLSEEKTGYDVAKILENPENLNHTTPVIVHTQNPVGMMNIHAALHGTPHLYLPFGSMLDGLDKAVDICSVVEHRGF